MLVEETNTMDCIFKYNNRLFSFQYIFSMNLGGSNKAFTFPRMEIASFVALFSLSNKNRKVLYSNMNNKMYIRH